MTSRAVGLVWRREQRAALSAAARATGIATSVATALALSGCASAPPATAPAAAADAVIAVAAPAAAPSVAAIERQQVQRARSAEAQGHWAEAALAWEVLSVLQPEQRSHAANLQRVRKLIDGRAAEGLVRAGDERRRGDLDRASRSYLQVLALAPDNVPAMDALRGIERERALRGQPGRFARNVAARGGAAAMSEPPAAPAASNLIEHASLLASQGELDSAIAMLAPAQSSGADPALRRALADLYFRRAEGLLPQQRAQAVQALNESLRLDPAHAEARARLKSLGARAP